MSIRLIDIRGFEDQRGYKNELSLLLEGRLPAAYIVRTFIFSSYCNMLHYLYVYYYICFVRFFSYLDYMHKESVTATLYDKSKSL